MDPIQAAGKAKKSRVLPVTIGYNLAGAKAG
jgi:hypothetical protein